MWNKERCYCTAHLLSFVKSCGMTPGQKQNVNIIAKACAVLAAAAWWKGKTGACLPPPCGIPVHLFAGHLDGRLRAAGRAQ